MDLERLETVEIIPFRSFKEKISITKKYFHTAKMEIIDNKYVYLKFRGENNER